MFLPNELQPPADLPDLLSRWVPILQGECLDGHPSRNPCVSRVQTWRFA